MLIFIVCVEQIYMTGTCFSVDISVIY